MTLIKSNVVEPRFPTDVEATCSFSGSNAFSSPSFLCFFSDQSTKSCYLFFINGDVSIYFPFPFPTRVYEQITRYNFVSAQ